MHWDRSLLLTGLLLLCIACAQSELPSTSASPPPQSTVVPTPPPPIELKRTPNQIAEELTTTASLKEAVDQLATLLTIPPTRIGIRIRSKDCTVCNLAEDGAQSQPPRLTRSEAETALNAYDLLWLVAEPLTCAYYYDGKRLTPRSCQVE